MDIPASLIPEAGGATILSPFESVGYGPFNAELSAAEVRRARGPRQIGENSIVLAPISELNRLPDQIGRRFLK